jgi:MSHA type pilus biogenesis protein MshL
MQKFIISCGLIFFLVFAYAQEQSSLTEQPSSSPTQTSEPRPLSQSSPASVAQPSDSSYQAPSIEEGLNQRMALDLRDLDIVDTLKFLAMKGGINIIAGKDVTGKVSLFLKNVTIKDALDIILLANNLAYEKRGDILYVMTEAEYKLAHGTNFKDTRKVRVFNLKYAKPESAFKTLDILKSDIGKVIVDEDSGTVVIMDTPEKIKEMERAVANLDQQNLTRTFSLQYAKAKDVQAILSARLDVKKTGTVSIDERNNQVIVTALPERLKEAEELIKGMDKRTKQVILEAKILKVILKDKFDMGVDWTKVINSMHKQSINVGSIFDFPSGGADDPTTYFKFGMGGAGHNYTVLVKLLQEFGETRNLSSPSIAVVNGQEARIHVGRTEAYVTTTIATGSTTSSTAAQVSFLDVGVLLMVTPLINDEGFITMKIKPEVSSVEDTLTYKIAADVDNTVPLVASTTAETTVMVKDGMTVVIGGLRKDEKIKTVDKLPFLGDIPFVGAAFRKTSDHLEKDEIIVLITPHIITGDVPVVAETAANNITKPKLKPKPVRGYQ